MKRYKKSTKNLIFIGIIVPILAFFVVMNVTYAFFTARTSSIFSKQSARLLIAFTDNEFSVNSQTITNSAKLLPGDDLEIAGSVDNLGNVQVYVVIKLEIYVKKVGETTNEDVAKKYFTVSGSTTQEITESNGDYSHTAFVLNGGASQTFAVPYDLDVDKFGDDYKKATLTYSLQAFAIQTISITDAEEATAMLIEQLST